MSERNPPFDYQASLVIKGLDNNSYLLILQCHPKLFWAGFGESQPNIAISSAPFMSSRSLHEVRRFSYFVFASMDSSLSLSSIDFVRSWDGGFGELLCIILNTEWLDDNFVGTYDIYIIVSVERVDVSTLKRFVVVVGLRLGDEVRGPQVEECHGQYLYESPSVSLHH